MEVIQSIGCSIDLNSTQQSQSLLDTSLSSVDNITNEHILRIIQSIRKFLHTIFSVTKTLSKGKDELLNSSLLKIRELLNLTALEYLGDAVGGRFGSGEDVPTGEVGPSEYGVTAA
ncbi:mucin-like protein [Thalassiosira pseudonana CCMP1335]|uniref:Mucin-like protein n=1 Tax=Thalassiosira pseudonana TaxID=35128 RepID=B8LE20_THAPS|nr:mucin-like protein [Thalassiosira pseudonana CCMP1335]EED86436.1 mucin-like protein [Thalassiosira pseudonana CCMP1335]